MQNYNFRAGNREGDGFLHGSFKEGTLTAHSCLFLRENTVTSFILFVFREIHGNRLLLGKYCARVASIQLAVDKVFSCTREGGGWKYTSQNQFSRECNDDWCYHWSIDQSIDCSINNRKQIANLRLDTFAMIFLSLLTPRVEIVVWSQSVRI